MIPMYISWEKNGECLCQNAQIIEQRVQSRTSHQHVCIKWSHNQKLHYWELRYGQIQKFSNPNNWKQNKHLLPTSCLDEGTFLHLHDIYRQQVISYSYSKIINQHLPPSFPQLVSENQMKLSSDQLRAASLIGRNAVTWLCALSTVRRAYNDTSLPLVIST